MATWKEQHFKGNSLTLTAQGITATRVFNVDATPEGALLELVGQGLNRGQPHPRFSTALFVANTNIIPTAFGCEVTANYTAAEFIGFPAEDIAAPEFIDIDTTFSNASVTLPVYQEAVKTFDIVSLFVYQRVQNVASFEYGQTVSRVTINAEVPSAAGVDQQLLLTQFINQQTNKLHEINGTWYLFNADGIRRLEKDKYQFTYRWTYDPGIPSTFGNNYEQGSNFIKEGSYLYPIGYKASGDESGADTDLIPDLTIDYIIPPYHRLDVADAAGDPTQIPLLRARPLYLKQSDGWQDLPGVLT